MRSVLFACVVAALSAMPAHATGEACVAAASGPWGSAGEGYTVEFIAGGFGDCANGVTATAVRGPGGDVFWTSSQVSGWNDFLSGAGDPEELQARLNEMADLSKAPFKTSGELPAWKPGNDTPGLHGKLPFFQADWLDQATYEGIRASNAPVFCFREATGYFGCYALMPDGNMDGIAKLGQLRLTEN